MPMPSLQVVFINSTLEPSPELSETGALWQLVGDLYQKKGCQIEKIRLADYEIFPNCRSYEGSGDEFFKVFDRICAADILILGIPTLQGQRSSEYQKLMERLRTTCREQQSLTTGQSPLYNIVAGVLLVGDSWGSREGLAHTCFDLGQMGCVNPPHNTVAWCQLIDTAPGFSEAEGQKSVTVNREARLLVEHTIAIACQLHESPLAINCKAIDKEVKAITKAAEVENGNLLTPIPITTETPAPSNCLHYRHVSRRIWTVMQAGMERGFTFSVLSLEDKIFRAEREGQGFTYKIYPGYFSYRNQYTDYDQEKSKVHKLALMTKHGLPVPTAYGSYHSVAEIPCDALRFPLVAKPDAGSLSENVFPNLQTVEQLQQAANLIEASGAVIKIESHIAGWDYRILVINHQYAGCVQRRPARVVGDGRHTIRQLFHQRNQEPGRDDRYESHTTLHQLVFDHTSRRLLHQAGYTLDTVLADGEVFYLQEKIPAALGSDYVDCTDDLHPSIVQQCIEFSHHFPCLTLGFDLIAPDITRPLNETGGAFNEYNTLPYVDLHEHCNVGQQRPVSHWIWDYIEANNQEIVTTAFKLF
jgi:D-alanine-D-alanine ligase-like ATP-grasp enzyme